MNLSRRWFLESAALSALAARAMAAEKDPKTGMPIRTLGKTGQRVSIVAFGAGSRWGMFKTPDAAIPALERALKAGVNYVDTAHNYLRGDSETWIGQMLKTRKKDFFLATKLEDRTADGAMRQLELSLKRLGLAQVDLLHIHGLAGADDLAKIEAKGGVLETLHKARDQKMTRFIGVTCHEDPAVLKTALERHDFDSTQMALNIAQMGNAKPSNVPGQGATGLKGFEHLALPVVLKKGMGVTAMKVFAQEKLLGKAPIETLIRYALSLPIAAATLGMKQLDQIDQNIQVAKSFQPMDPQEMRKLSDSVATEWKASIDRFFAAHVDC